MNLLLFIIFVYHSSLLLSIEIESNSLNNINSLEFVSALLCSGVEVMIEVIEIFREGTFRLFWINENYDIRKYEQWGNISKRQFCRIAVVNHLNYKTIYIQILFTQIQFIHPLIYLNESINIVYTLG